MIEINLLPREYYKKSFDFSMGKTGLYLAAGAAGVLLLMAGITVFQLREISKLEENIERARRRAAMLQKDIQLVDALQEVKLKITNRMAAVERLDRHRSVWVRIMEDVAKNVPDFIWLARFELQEPPSPVVAKRMGTETQPDTVTTIPQEPTSLPVELEGYAFTLNSLASFMINMMRSDYFEDVELVSSSEIEIEGHKTYNFVLSCDLNQISDEELRNLIATSEDRNDNRPSTTSHKSLN